MKCKFYKKILKEWNFNVVEKVAIIMLVYTKYAIN